MLPSARDEKAIKIFKAREMSLVGDAALSGGSGRRLATGFLLTGTIERN